MNGPKIINKTIEISAAEAGSYTPYMYDKSKQKAWIKANYPGAEVEKGYSLSVVIN